MEPISQAETLGVGYKLRVIILFVTDAKEIVGLRTVRLVMALPTAQ